MNEDRPVLSATEL